MVNVLDEFYFVIDRICFNGIDFKNVLDVVVVLVLCGLNRFILILDFCIIVLIYLLMVFCEIGLNGLE